jgi:hypothetical protein
VGVNQLQFSDISNLSSHHPSSVDWHISKERKVPSQEVQDDRLWRARPTFQILDNSVARGYDKNIKEEGVSAKIASKRL